MVQIYYNRAPSQDIAHFYLIVSILEDISNAIGYGPLSMDNIKDYFCIKSVGSRYMILKRGYKKHICLLLNKPKYKFFAAYMVNKKYCDGSWLLKQTEAYLICK